MRGLYFFLILLIVTYGKSILCAFFLFSCICNKRGWKSVGVSAGGWLLCGLCSTDLQWKFGSMCLIECLMSSTVSPSTHRVISLRGENVTLPCVSQSNSALSFCWGREKVPTFKCSETILSSKDGAVVYRQSARYQLQGRLTDGDVSLTILNVQWSDAGVYGCRVEIPGWFNDHKVNIHLVIEEGNACENNWG